MHIRKNRNNPEQGRVPRQVRQGSANPAFSYYASRSAEANRQRLPGVGNTSRPARTEQVPRHRRAIASQLPFWLLVVVGVVCAGKVLALGTSPKVIVLGQTSTTSSYQQSTAAYASAAHKLLASSITNRTKLTANLGGTATAMQRQFPELQTVSLGVPLIGSRPIVYVQVAQPSLVLQSGRGNFALNKSGVVLARLQDVPSNIPVLVDQSNAVPQPGAQFLPSSTIGFVQTVAYQFTASKITVSAFVLPASSPFELDVRIAGQPYTIRCNLTVDATTQSGAAIATVLSLSGATPTQYIDVRTPGRAYYK